MGTGKVRGRQEQSTVEEEETVQTKPSIVIRSYGNTVTGAKEREGLMLLQCSLRMECLCAKTSVGLNQNV